MMIRIIVHKLLDDEGKLLVGGIQTYIYMLAKVLSANGYNVIIYQFGTSGYTHKDFNGLGFDVVAPENCLSSKSIIAYFEQENCDYLNDIVIFSDESLLQRNKFKKVIAIQHGIAWDITDDEKQSDTRNIMAILKGSIRSIKKYYKLKNCSDVVCVDYNFLNWYRTQVLHIDQKIHIIPNFASSTINRELRNKEMISIIFARRLFQYRGTRLFANAIAPILETNKDLKITIAGDGPDKVYMKEKLSKYDNVNFTTFFAEESASFHSDYDIAVVPTKGSEGTSLSLLEAMSAGCAVICTNIGGMTNIILDGFNGIMINPDVNELQTAINKLIDNKSLRDYLSKNAQETVRKSFSFDRWKNGWLNVVKSIDLE